MAEKSHQEIVSECANAAVACWNYYSDKPLTDVQIDNLRKAVALNLPVGIKTEDWEQYAT